MLSPNLLKSQSPYVGGGGGGGGKNPTFNFLMLNPNLLKSKKKFGRGFVEIFLSFLTKIATAKKLILSTVWPRRTLCVRGTITRKLNCLKFWRRYLTLRGNYETIYGRSTCKSMLCSKSRKQHLFFMHYALSSLLSFGINLEEGQLNLGFIWGFPLSFLKFILICQILECN